MTKKQNLAAVVGSYEKDGEQKNRYTNVGSIITKDDGGKFIELNWWVNYATLPRKDGKLYLSVFDEDGDKKASTGSSEAPKAAKPSVTDEIPF